MHFALTGHRTCLDKEKINDVMDRVYRMYRDMVLTCGGAAGLDTIAAQWAMRNGVVFDLIYPFPYNDRANREVKKYAREVVELHDKYKGNWQFPERNIAMVDTNEMVLAFYDGRRAGGTFHCMNYAKKVLMPIIEIDVRNW